MTPSSRMAREVAEAPAVVARQEKALARPLTELARRLRERPPSLVVTCARGSSAHAATFGKYLVERFCGLPVAAAAPSIASVYRSRLRLKGQLFLAISQSGRSDDLVEMASVAKAQEAITAAIVNDTASPLASCCDIVLPMSAGPELSVAATKTFIATCAALLRLSAEWTEDSAMEGAAGRLPERLARTSELDWAAAASGLFGAPSLAAIGRGPTLAIAREAALKLKEIFGVHAEAFSGAEFLHGPVALVSSRYPVLLFMPQDEAEVGMRELAEALTDKGTELFATGWAPPAGVRLEALRLDSAEADAVCLIQSFYALLVRWAELRGVDADRPRHLEKVTRTR